MCMKTLQHLCVFMCLYTQYMCIHTIACSVQLHAPQIGRKETTPASVHTLPKSGKACFQKQLGLLEPWSELLLCRPMTLCWTKRHAWEHRQPPLKMLPTPPSTTGCDAVAKATYRRWRHNKRYNLVEAPQNCPLNLQNLIETLYGAVEALRKPRATPLGILYTPRMAAPVTYASRYLKQQQVKLNKGATESCKQAFTYVTTTSNKASNSLKPKA